MPQLVVTEISNGSPEQVEAAIADLFDIAQDSVIMSTGLYFGFYGREKISKSMLSAAERVKSFRIILDAYVDVEEAKQKLPWLFHLEAKEKVNIARTEHSVQHWMLVDDKHLRLEKPHLPTEAGTSNLIVKNANTSEKTAYMIVDVASELNQLWQSAKPIG
jgi:hypothetical protein